MGRAKRLWRLWTTLPDDERRARTGRVLDRVLRRRPGWLRERAALRRGDDLLRSVLTVAPGAMFARLAEDDTRRGPLFAPLDARVERCARDAGHVAAIERAADAALEHRFERFAEDTPYPTTARGGLDWHVDPVSGYRWREDAYHLDVDLVPGDGSDVKRPWELARSTQLVRLGQAYRLRVRRGDALAAARAAGHARRTIEDFSRANPPGVGLHWSCAMEVAIRAISWNAALALFRGAASWDAPFVGTLVGELWRHGAHIRRNLEAGEGRIATNHYLADLVGLLSIATTLPELRDAAAWRTFAVRELSSEMERQVTPEGASFERSLPYHRFVGELWLHAVTLARAARLPEHGPWAATLERMVAFTELLARPDGTVPRWGDDDDGHLLPLEPPTDACDVRTFVEQARAELRGGRVASDGAAISWVQDPWIPPGGTDARADVPSVAGAGDDDDGAEPPETCRWLDDAGIGVLAAADVHATFSCGPVGTEGLGNHTHNDQLALTLWARGTEWVIDPGTGTYGADFDTRNALRGTAAHATVQVADVEQNEIPPGAEGLFRLVERAHPERTTAPSGGLCGRHRGFSRDGATLVHERTVRLDARRRAIVVHDRLEGAATDEPVATRWPTAPGVHVDLVETSDCPAAVADALDRALADLDAPAVRVAARLRRDEDTFWIAAAMPPGTVARLANGIVSPRYGVVRSATVIECRTPSGAAFAAATVLVSPPASSSRASSRS